MADIPFYLLKNIPSLFLSLVPLKTPFLFLCIAVYRYFYSESTFNISSYSDWSLIWDAKIIEHEKLWCDSNYKSPNFYACFKVRSANPQFYFTINYFLRIGPRALELFKYIIFIIYYCFDMLFLLSLIHRNLNTLSYTYHF